MGGGGGGGRRRKEIILAQQIYNWMKKKESHSLLLSSVFSLRSLKKSFKKPVNFERIVVLVVFLVTLDG